jgi:hypothetical protein
MSENAIDTLSRATGLSKGTMEEIWLQVKANHKKLESCSGHDFSLPERKTRQLVMTWRCSRCGGIVESSAKRWYELGLKHGKTASSP